MPPMRRATPVGILGLPYALASLGWVAGTLTLAFITASSCYSAFLLADVSWRGSASVALVGWTACMAAVAVPMCGLLPVVTSGLHARAAAAMCNPSISPQRLQHHVLHLPFPLASNSGPAPLPSLALLHTTP